MGRLGDASLEKGHLSRDLNEGREGGRESLGKTMPARRPASAKTPMTWLAWRNQGGGCRGSRQRKALKTTTKSFLFSFFFFKSFLKL